MLSPDPVTQAPENGQNYGRYTYALNNPLKYTDPSGYESTGGVSIGYGGTSGGMPGNGGGRSIWSYARWFAAAGNSDLLDYLEGTRSAEDFENEFTNGLDSGGHALNERSGCTGGLALGGLGCGYDIPNFFNSSPAHASGDKGHDTAKNMVNEAIKTGALDPLKVFRTAEEAAKEVLSILQSITNITGVEIGGSISTASGGYTYGWQDVGWVLPRFYGHFKEAR